MNILNLLKKFVLLYIGLIRFSLALCCIALAFASFPSIATIAFLVVGIICLPFKKIHSFIENKFKLKKGPFKTVIFVAMLFLGLFTMPASPEPIEPIVESTPVIGSDIAESVENSEPISTPTTEPTPTLTAEPTPSPTAEPTPSPTAEPTPSPTAEPTPSPTAKPTPTPIPKPVITEYATTMFAISNGTIWSGPYDNYAVLGRYNSGTEVTVTGKATDKDGDIWYRINYNGKEGYMSQYHLSDTKPAPIQKPSDGENNVTVPQPETQGHLVWVPTNGGTKYHSNAGCSKMKNPIQVSIETAKANGFTACGRCY